MSDEDFAPEAQQGGAQEPAAFTAAALILMWVDRDVLYARLPKALTDEQVMVIRQGRLREVNLLPAPERSRPWARASAWYPPQNGQGTGDDDAGNVDGLRGFAE